jgi:hypothetical protein
MLILNPETVLKSIRFSYSYLLAAITPTHKKSRQPNVTFSWRPDHAYFLQNQDTLILNPETVLKSIRFSYF